MRLGGRRAGRQREALAWLERQAELMRSEKKIATMAVNTATELITVSSDFAPCGCGSIIWATAETRSPHVRTITRADRFQCNDH